MSVCSPAEGESAASSKTSLSFPLNDGRVTVTYRSQVITGFLVIPSGHAAYSPFCLNPFSKILCSYTLYLSHYFHNFPLFLIILYDIIILHDFRKEIIIFLREK